MHLWEKYDNFILEFKVIQCKSNKQNKLSVIFSPVEIKTMEQERKLKNLAEAVG